MNLVFGYLVITRKANQLASGLATMFLGFGLSALIGKDVVGAKIAALPRFFLPGTAGLPPLYSSLFRFDALVFLVIPVAILIWWLLFRTRWGLGVRAVGENADIAFASGRNPRRIRYQALFVAGLLAGLGAAHLTIAYTMTWTEYMTGGRGFIAVALVIFSKWHPLRAIAGALLFSGAVAFQLLLQASGVQVSPFLLDTFPYILTCWCSSPGAATASSLRRPASGACTWARNRETDHHPTLKEERMRTHLIVQSGSPASCAPLLRADRAARATAGARRPPRRAARQRRPLHRPPEPTAEPRSGGSHEPTRRPPAAKQRPCLIVGALYGGPKNDAGYNQAMPESMATMTKNISCVKLIEAENVPDEAGAKTTMENMIQQGAKLIFATAFNHQNPAFELAKTHKDVIFEHAGGWMMSDNFANFYGAPPNGWYAMGVAAGLMTKSNKLGFVAAFPMGWTTTFINAFEQGAKSVNPKVADDRRLHLQLGRSRQGSRHDQLADQPGRGRDHHARRLALHRHLDGRIARRLLDRLPGPGRPAVCARVLAHRHRLHPGRQGHLADAAPCSTRPGSPSSCAAASRTAAWPSRRSARRCPRTCRTRSCRP